MAFSSCVNMPAVEDVCCDFRYARRSTVTTKKPTRIRKRRKRDAARRAVHVVVGALVDTVYNTVVAVGRLTESIASTEFANRDEKSYCKNGKHVVPQERTGRV